MERDVPDQFVQIGHGIPIRIDGIWINRFPFLCVNDVTLHHLFDPPCSLTTERSSRRGAFPDRTPSDGYLLTTKEKQEVGAPRLKVRRKLLEKVFAES